MERGAAQGPETAPFERPKPLSMISWREESPVPRDDLRWDLDDDASPAPAPSSSGDDGAALEALLALGERASLAEALPDLATLLAGRTGSEVAAVAFESTLAGGQRLVAAARDDGFDAALSSALASLTGHELAGALRSALPRAAVEAWSLPVGARAWCTVWLARDAVAPVLDAGLARAAGVALRAVFAGEALERGGAAVELLQRDRRETVMGRLTRAAAAPLVAAHASLAAVQASLAAELAELRMTSPRHASIRASVALLQEATGLTQGAWQVLSGMACLGDDASQTCDPAQVIQAAAALAAPYLAPRAALEVVPARLPLVRVAPAAVAEALVVFLTRAAQRFDDAPGRVAVTASAAGGVVEVEVRALAAPDATDGRGHDEVVADVFHRALAERFGGGAEVVRDASGAARFRLTLPAA